MSALPTDADVRKGIPLTRGLLDYFPAALSAVAAVSHVGNAQHNPGQPMHWSRDKSSDHADALLRHLIDRGGIDSDGLRHSAKVAWRALALLQVEIERAEGAPSPRGAAIPIEHRGEHAVPTNPAIDPDIAELMPDNAPPEAYAGD